MLYGRHNRCGPILNNNTLAQQALDTCQAGVDCCQEGLSEVQNGNRCRGRRNIVCGVRLCERGLNELMRVLSRTGADSTIGVVNGIETCQNGLRKCCNGVRMIRCGDIADGEATVQQGINTCNRGLEQIRNSL